LISFYYLISCYFFISWYYSSNNPSTTWSQCSKDQLVYAFQHGMDYCLYNKPPTVFDPTSVCANGLIESGEQCDCGRAPASECNPQCCNNTTCQLSPNAACAAGRCCDISSCQVIINYLALQLANIWNITSLGHFLHN